VTSVHEVDTAVVRFQSVGLQFSGSRPVVSDLTFDVRSSEILILLGRSGAGKTSALKLINGLLMPTAGVVEVEKRSTHDWDRARLRRRIGYVIQEIGLFPHMTVERNVGIVPELEGWDTGRRRARVAELLELVGLEPASFGDRYPSQLSGGQRQRVGIARALAADPPLLLLDEPFGALDPLTRLELQHELKRLQERLAKTMVFVTHDVREGLFLASRIALFHQGRLAFLGTPSQFLTSTHPEAEAFAAVVRPDDRPASADDGGEL
jgi:osmoprotectant transport system ATP-binding protein